MNESIVDTSFMRLIQHQGTYYATDVFRLGFYMLSALNELFFNYFLDISFNLYTKSTQ